MEEGPCTDGGPDTTDRDQGQREPAGGGGVIHGLEWYIRDRPCMEEEEYM